MKGNITVTIVLCLIKCFNDRTIRHYLGYHASGVNPGEMLWLGGSKGSSFSGYVDAHWKELVACTSSG